MKATRRIRSWAVLSGVIALTTVACAGGDSPTVPSGARSVALPSSSTALPTFTVADFDAVLSHQGRPTVVNIWASWCGPCRVEAPELAKAAQEFQGRVQFLGVDIIDQRPAAVTFIHRYGWPYPSVFDPTGAIRDDLGLIGQPHTVVFDAQGHRTYVSSGPVTQQELRTELTKLTAADTPMAMALVATVSPTPSTPSNGTSGFGLLLGMAAAALLVGSLSLLYLVRRLRRGVDSCRPGDPFGPA